MHLVFSALRQQKVLCFILFSLISANSIAEQTFHPPYLNPFGKSTESLLSFFDQTEKKSKQHSWWANYKRFQVYLRDKQNKKACETLLKLSSEEDFPLQKVVVFKSLKHCPKISTRVDMESIASTTPLWLEKLSLETQAEFYQAQRKNALAAEALQKRAGFERNKRNKEKLIIEARELAKDSRNFVLANELQAQLRKLSPRFAPRPKGSNARLKRAHDLRRAREFKKARFEYRLITKSKASFKTQASARRFFAFTHKLQGNKKAYLKSYQDYVTWIRKGRRGKSDLRWKAEVQLVKIYWTQGQRSRAERNLNFLLKQEATPDAYRFESNFILGLIAMEKEQWDQADGYFGFALNVNPEVKIEDVEKVLWAQSWSRLRGAKFDKAIQPLDKLIEELPEGHSNRYRFWKAWLLEQKSPKKAKKIYKWLAKNSLYSYYGLLAHKQLGANLELVYKQSFDNAKLFDSMEKKVLGEHVLSWLLAVGEHQLAKEYLANKAELIEKESKFKQRLVALNHSYLKTFASFSRFEKDKKRKWMKNELHQLFPNPFGGLVSDSAGNFAIDQELVLAIMRQESAFNPIARSHMDAFGLLQLLPRTARGSAQRNNLSFSKAEDLFQPEVVIPLGTAYLRELLVKHKGSLILTAANYNANDDAVKGWLKSRYTKNPLIFIEEIPYKETRTYVKLILRNYMIYKTLNSKEGSWAVSNDIFKLL